jgi:hypothetical protein
VNATALIRGMFHKISDKPQPGMGVFPPDWLESTFMPAAVRKVTSTRALHEFSLQYGEPLGDSSLRRACRQAGARSTCRPRPSRSSPRSVPRMRWTSSAARCCARATR